MNEILQTVEERWNKHSERYDSGHQGHLSNEDMALWKLSLVNHIGKEKQKRILDVGCGTGFLTLKIADLGYDCRGLDLSEGMLGIAKKKAAEQGLNIEFMKGNVADLPFPDNDVDIITNRSLLWTLFEPQKSMNEWRRVLKPEGKLLCFCSVGGKHESHNHHYDQDMEDMLQLKNGSVSLYCSQLEQAGFSEVEAVLLEGIRGRHGNSPWYVFKGKKM